MKLIELHYSNQPYSLNVDYIASVIPHGDWCEVYMVGDKKGDQYNTDESYDEVLRLIKEATNG